MNYSTIFKDSFKPLKERQLAFLNDCINHYTSKNRGIETGSINTCSYVAGCQIGRHINTELRDELDKLEETIGGLINKLPTWMQELDDLYLEDIQRLHDISANWDEKGLSECGKDVVRSIKENYQLF